MTGKIARIMEDKGFGFIHGTDGKDYFFHRSGIADGDFSGLQIHDDVEFEVQNAPKGPRAEGIRRK